MIRNVLSDLGGVGIYGIVSMLIFFTFFIGMLIWVFRLSRTYVSTMERLPMTPDNQSATDGDSRHE